MVSAADATTYTFEDFRVDAAKRLFFGANGKVIALKPKVFDTLLYLVDNSGRLIEKDELMSAIWVDAVVEENNLNKNISALRQALGENPGQHRFIVTVPGRGYKFVASVSKLAEGNGSVVNSLSTVYEPPGQVSSNRGSRRFLLITLSAALVAGLGFAGLYTTGQFSPSSPINSVAVLPLVNATGDEGLDYIAEGLSEGLIDRLSAVSSVKVIARDSSFRYRGEGIDLREVASKLGVQAVVKGRLAKRDNKLDVRVEMIDVRNDRQVFSERFTRDSNELIDVQSDIAVAAGDKLLARITGSTGFLAKGQTANPEAYQQYLLGRFLLNKSSPKELYRAFEAFQNAVTLDPNFALAYVGLAESTGRLSSQKNVSKQEFMKKAREHALRALSLNDELPEAHTTYGGILLLSDYDFAGAESEYSRALKLSPNYSEAHLRLGQLFSILGRHDEAKASIRRGLEVDPISLESNQAYGEALFFAREYDASIEHLKKIISLEERFFPARRFLAFNYEMKGDYAARIEEAYKLNEIGNTRENGEAMRASFARGGWAGFLRDATSDDPLFELHPYLIATFSASSGNHDKAISILQSLLDKRTSDLILLKVDPRLDPLRDDARFTELLRKVGF